MPPAEAEWVVLHSRPRAEKKLQQSIEQLGHQVYLPLRKKEHRYGGRRRAFSSPLFPGYLFAMIPSAFVSKLKSNDHVANVLRVVAQAQLVQELSHIQRAVESGELIEVMPAIQAGTAVRIVGGPLKGVVGHVAATGDKSHVMITIEMIQKSVVVKVDSAFIELADEE